SLAPSARWAWGRGSRVQGPAVGVRSGDLIRAVQGTRTTASGGVPLEALLREGFQGFRFLLHFPEFCYGWSLKFSGKPGAPRINARHKGGRPAPRKALTPQNPRKNRDPDRNRIPESAVPSFAREIRSERQ